MASGTVSGKRPGEVAADTNPGRQRPERGRMRLLVQEILLG